MWTELLTALALLLILEGIMPFANPQALRRMFIMVSKLDDAILRFTGLTSMCIGLLLLYLIR